MPDSLEMIEWSPAFLGNFVECLDVSLTLSVAGELYCLLQFRSNQLSAPMLSKHATFFNPPHLHLHHHHQSDDALILKSANTWTGEVHCSRSNAINYWLQRWDEFPIHCSNLRKMTSWLQIRSKIRWCYFLIVHVCWSCHMTPFMKIAIPLTPYQNIVNPFEWFNRESAFDKLDIL